MVVGVIWKRKIGEGDGGRRWSSGGSVRFKRIGHPVPYFTGKWSGSGLTEESGTSKGTPKFKSERP